MVRHARSPIGRILPRHAAAQVEESLTDTRVVLVNGARQAGKSTLVTGVGSNHDSSWLSLDDAMTRQAAYEDPSEFVRSDRLLIIDEIQRDPQLLLAIKSAVDRDGRPGHFLLTGSARILGLRNLPDTLVGRMETIELWPLSQGEIDGGGDGFVDHIFDVGSDLRHTTDEDRGSYVERLVRGGFPEAVARTGNRRSRFFDSYISDLINRDVMQLSALDKLPQIQALINMTAQRSGQLMVPANLAKQLGVTQQTVSRHLQLLEEVFLVKHIPAWTRRISARATSTKKAAMVDSGIATHVLGLDSRALRRISNPLGPLLEGFVTMEIARQLTWSATRAQLFHYRTKDQVEVDIVLETPRGQVVAFEVKASSTVRREDFAGLRHLAERVGDDFLVGGVLHTGRETLSFGPNLLAIPIAAIWEMPA